MRLKVKSYNMKNIIIPMLGLLGLFLNSCNKQKTKQTEQKTTKSSQKRQLHEVKNIKEVANIDGSKSELAYNQILKDLSEEQLADQALLLLETDKREGKISQDKLSLILAELIKRKSNLIENVVRELPPGLISDSVVSTAVSKYPFTSKNDAQAVGSLIQDDHYRFVAMESAWTSIAIRSLGNNIKEPITYEDIASINEIPGKKTSNLSIDLFKIAYKQKSVGDQDAIYLFKNVDSGKLGMLLPYLSPEGSISFMKERLNENPQKQKLDDSEEVALGQLAANLTSLETKKALETVSSLPPYAADKMTSQVFKILLKRDPSSVEHYIKNSEMGKSRDIAIKELILATPSNSEKFQYLEDQISDSSIRGEIEKSRSKN